MLGIKNRRVWPCGFFVFEVLVCNSLLTPITGNVPKTHQTILPKETIPARSRFVGTFVPTIVHFHAFHRILGPSAPKTSHIILMLSLVIVKSYIINTSTYMNFLKNIKNDHFTATPSTGRTLPKICSNFHPKIRCWQGTDSLSTNAL